ncbi:MAG TPA: hypothetical protein VGA70_08565, partial [Longimicrobiales bacterium]
MALATAGCGSDSVPTGPTADEGAHEALVAGQVSGSGATEGRIAFHSTRAGGAIDIYVMDADGSNITRITSLTSHNTSPAWSPDGTRIAFNSSREGLQDDIYVMEADGSNQTRLTFDSADDFEPSWSPDGTKIAFASERDDSQAREIYVMDADGSNLTRLTNNAADDLSPNWSPD